MQAGDIITHVEQEMRGKAQRVARQRKRACKTRGLLDQRPKFTKFLSDVEGSTAVLTRASMLRSSHTLWNASP